LLKFLEIFQGEGQGKHYGIYLHIQNTVS